MPPSSKKISTYFAKADATSSQRASRKRASDADADEDSALSTPVGKKRRSTKKERSAADPENPVNNLVDSLRPGLTLVMIGLNPGLTTAATGHAYAHPSNHFWRLLHRSGLTRIQHAPSETRALMDLYSIGNTNICARPTRTGDGLTKEELVEGAGILDEKIARFKPKAVCIVGKGIWDVIYKAKTGKALKGFSYGWQDEKLWLGRTMAKDGTLEWPGAKTFVATTTSGLAATMSSAQKLEIWNPIGQWFQEQRDLDIKEEAAEVEKENEEVKEEDEEIKEEE